MLSETWNNFFNVDLCNLEDYRGYYLPWKTIFAIFCLNDSYIGRLDSLFPCSENIEVCSASIGSNSLSLFTIGIYRPPHSSVEKFIENF